MASSISSNPTPFKALALLPKLSDADADLRYMSLNDLYTLLNAGSPTFLHSDYHTCAKIVDGIIQTLDDQNGEVQNQAIKCVGALVVKLPPDILAPFVHRVSNIKTTHSVDSSVPATALRTFITSFPPPLARLLPAQKTQDAYSAISRVLIPRLLGYIVIPQGIENLPAPPPGMLNLGAEKGVNSDAVDVLIEVVRCFGPMLDDREKQALQKTVLAILDDERSTSVIKKKAVTAISLLAIHVSDRLLNSLISSIIESFRAPNVGLARRRLLITVSGSLVRLVPHRMGPHLKTLAPYVLTALGENEFEAYEKDAAEDGGTNPDVEEVREAALVALEACLSSCSKDMVAFTTDAIDASLRFLTYDPMAANYEEDEEMGGTQDDDDEDGFDNDDENFATDEDFEEDVALSDDDDSSWKIRRCAAKNIYALISTRSIGDLLDNGTLYEKVAPVLINRFKEREENVRLEILTTLASLIRKTGEGLSVFGSPAMQSTETAVEYNQRSRKRRRVDSDSGLFDRSGTFSSTIGLMSPAASPSPVTGPRADLARLSPAIVRGIAKLLRQPSVATKQAAVTLLRELIMVQSGGLSDLFAKLVEPLVDAVRGSGMSSAGAAVSSIGGAAAATGSRMRIEALQLISAVCDTHSSKVLSPHIGIIIPSVIAGIGDKYYKVSSEALRTIESIIKALTPPRSAGSDEQRKAYLNDIYESILPRSLASDVDLEVRQQAIHALGVLLARTSSSGSLKLLPAEKRQSALSVLQDRLKNETTRLAAIKAVDLVIAPVSDSADLQSGWLKQVTVELAAQLRKADRVLRSTSLSALKDLVSNQITLKILDDGTVNSLAEMLLPLLSSNDLNMMGMAMACLNKLVGRSPKGVINADLNATLCQVILTPLGGSVSDTFLGLVQTIGEKGVGQPLMQGLLQDVGVSGDSSLVGKAIGTLLVSGKESLEVGIDDFIGELKTSKDPQRKCLALSVLGEAGLRLGSSSPLEPELFSTHFNSKSESVPRAAAVALGRAGAGNVPHFLPLILANASKAGQLQYLSLHSIKEILQLGGAAHSHILPYTKKIWEKLMDASQAEDTKVIGAECIGRIAVIEPVTYLPILQEYLKDSSPIVRGMAIQALRFTLTDSDEQFEEILKPVLVKMLGIMLNDPNIENRRLALSTLNSATHNKPDIILPPLGSLIPFVMKDSKPDPDLIREVQMGPFRHKVDDGLELRKNAYETLFSFIESAYSRMNHIDLFDRVIAGLEDEHEIKMLCSLMLTKLCALDPDETFRRLDSIGERFRVVLSTKPKENAVKQEVEKVTEANKAAIKVTLQLNETFPQISIAGPNPQGQTWKAYWEWLSKEFKTQLHSAEQEVKSQA